MQHCQFLVKKVVVPATPIAIQPIAKDFPALPQSFFCRPAEVVGPELLGCRLVQFEGSTHVPLGLKDAEAIGSEQQEQQK